MQTIQHKKRITPVMATSHHLSDLQRILQWLNEQVVNYSDKTRLQWVRMYEAVGDADIVCRRCGISRPTLRMWLKRYRTEGEAGLVSCSQRPKHSPNQKVSTEHEQWILNLRKRCLGARRIENELARLHEVHLSLRTIHKVLTRHNVKPLTRRRRQSNKIGCQRDVPGERVQMDNMKLADQRISVKHTLYRKRCASC